MSEAAWKSLNGLLGLERDIGDVNAVQMALRAITIYVLTLAIVRLGSKRFLGKGSAFDIIAGIMIGSVMSRAINGSAPFFPTLAAGAAMIGLHWIFAGLAFHTSWFGTLIKGRSVLLVEHGVVQPEGMQRASLSENDLAEALRLQASIMDPSKVRLAYLERDGNISVIPAKQRWQVLEVSVQEGVQSVRIEIER
jgi:uncharacterized membrane protein YcaP (DUF421 family)